MKTFCLVVPALALCAGCGRREEAAPAVDPELISLRAKVSAHERRIAAYEGEIEALRGRLAEEIGRVPPAPAAPPPVAALVEPAPPVAAHEQVPLVDAPPAEAAAEARPDEDAVERFAAALDEKTRERFRADLAAYAASLGTRGGAEAAPQRRETMLRDLRDRMAEATEPDERDLLEDRIRRIEEAHPEDLAGVLDYFDELERIESVNRMMEEYGIGREQLRALGVEPPPRRRWGPESAEIASNLESFVERYEPLVDQGRREQYRREFGERLKALTARPTDADLARQRERMLAELRERQAASPEEDQRRLQRQLRRLEHTDLDGLRRMAEYRTYREIGAIAEQYGIPRAELRETGVWIPQRGRRRDTRGTP
ncbi:MAG: hypothetical protein PHN82_04980 [bacterium]|nr:hypothetical protein [bacterium]